MHALRNCDFCDAEAVGTFEIVPADLEPTEAEQRRVVLCADCQRLLADLLEPLLARAGASDADSSTGVGASADARATDSRDSDRGQRTAVVDGTDVRPAGEAPVTRDESWTGITLERDESADGASGASGEAGAGSTVPAGDATTEVPPAYKKVMRLLRNRKLPLHRADVEELVASAYDLEDDEVEAVIEHAIANGEFVADGDELRRP